jgi:leucyl aminopeptidase
MTRPPDTTSATALTVSAAEPAAAEVDAVVIGIHRDGDGLAAGPGASAIDAALGGRLLETLARLGATGVAGEVVKLATLGATTAPVVAVVGLGPLTPEPGAPVPDQAAVTETYRRAAGAAIRALTGTGRVGFALTGGSADGTARVDGSRPDNDTLVRAVLEGAALGAYDFTRYKSEQPAGYRPPVTEVVILDRAPATRETVNRVGALVQAVRLARDWINTPPNDLRPPDFAAAARDAAEKAGLTVEVLDPEALAAGGYGGILAVGNGSAAGPRLVRISYQPTDDGGSAGDDEPRVPHVALIGKGITFDTGGISIKPSLNMQDMKSDMSGAACVIAAMTAIAALAPAVRVTAYAPMAENMPSGSAYRPGDVVTMYGGNRVEVFNTDAEGRMVLGDAIARACEDEPDYLIETSTLTGGQVISLGERIAGLMGTPELTERLRLAGQRTGEPMWAMPLPDEVRSSMDSSIADFSQISAGFDRAGHMLQGGVFLSRFVTDGVSWAHVDIAGPSYNTKTPHGYTPKGATGVPLRTLVEIVEDIAVNG